MSAPAALPRSRVPDPAAAPPLRWGVLGTGWIAERFVDVLQRRTAQQVTAVGSRTGAAATAFADRFGVPRAHPTYAALVADDTVDVVYVATPHNAHLAGAELAMRAGKHVLIEKPIALNAAQARQVMGVAAATDRFCMEAMWTFFLPKFDVLRQVVAGGMLGELRSFLADFGEHFAAGHRILRQDLAGGPMLDLGSYPVATALSLLGAVDRVLAMGTPAPTGVNGQAGMLLGHGPDRQSVLHTTLFGATPTGAVITATEATVTIPGTFYRPGPFRIDFSDGRPALVYDEPLTDYDGLAYEAAEVARMVTAGHRQSPIRALQDSVDTLAVLDTVRAQIGAVFDEER